MSQFEIKCPHCGVALSIQEEWIGMILECPECKKEFSVQESQEETPSTEQSPIGGNELSDDGQHSESCEENPPQGEKSQPMQNLPETQPATYRKSRRVIFLIAGVFILLLAAAVSYYFITCSRMVSSAVADGKLLLSDPSKSPDSSALSEAQAGLDEVNSKYWFVFAKRRTEELRNQLTTAGMVVSVIAEGESILHEGRSDKFQETINKLKQTAAKYPFPFAKRRTEELIKQIGSARMVVAVIDEGESVLRGRQYGKYQKTIDQLEKAASKYPFAFVKPRTESLIERLNVRIPSQEAIKALNVNDSEEKPQLTINKTINPRNKWFLYIFTMDRKKDVAAIFVKTENIGRNFQQYRTHLEESVRLRNQAAKIRPSPSSILPDAESAGDQVRAWHTCLELSDRAVKQAELGKQAVLQAGACHKEVSAWLVLEGFKAMKDISNGTMKMRTEHLTSNTCTLSNVRGPVILLAVETIDFGDGFSSFQGWYKEYEPAAAAETWTLN